MNVETTLVLWYDDNVLEDEWEFIYKLQSNKFPTSIKIIDESFEGDKEPKKYLQIINGTLKDIFPFDKFDIIPRSTGILEINIDIYISPENKQYYEYEDINKTLQSLGFIPKE